MPNKRIIPRVCRQCRREFLATAYRVSVGRAIFCSRACKDTPIVVVPPSALASPDGLTAKIPICSRDNTILQYATVDIADAAWASQWQWRMGKSGYAARTIGVNGRRVTFLMHRQLLGLTHHDGLEGDHVNRDHFDNRRENLRVIPKEGRGNTQNQTVRGGSSQYRGVSWHRDRRKWQASVTASYKRHYLGLFDSEDAAAEAAREARSRLMPFAID